MSTILDVAAGILLAAFIIGMVRLVGDYTPNPSVDPTVSLLTRIGMWVISIVGLIAGAALVINRLFFR